jgi:signal transduction histidine kinase
MKARQPSRSLRSRVLLGAVLWTVGLFTVSGIAITQVMYSYPRAPRLFHGAFSHVLALSIVAIVCMIAGLAQVRGGVAAIERLRARLAAVHEGRAPRVDGEYPTEVQPLVDDLNGLLDHRDLVIHRAVAKAGDLAHGLKTPLAVLARDADRARSRGDHALAESIAQQVGRMRRQVDYHLAHARAAASGATPGTRCAVAESAGALARTLLRLHADRGLRIDVDVPADHTVRVQREDLDEMLGNLLDNACTWARVRVAIASSPPTRDAAAAVIVTVDDDGPGLAAGLRERVLQRGVRADETGPGSGLGLAIVRDLAELHGGSIALEASPLGGLRAVLRLPA